MNQRSNRSFSFGVEGGDHLAGAHPPVHQLFSPRSRQASGPRSHRDRHLQAMAKAHDLGEQRVVGLGDHAHRDRAYPQQQLDHPLLPALKIQRFADNGGRGVESVEPQIEPRRANPQAKAGLLPTNGRRCADSEGLEQLHVGPERAG